MKKLTLIVGLFLAGLLSALELNEEEKAWIKANPTVRCFLMDSPPYHFQEDGKETTGICVELLNDIAEQTGLKIEYVKGETLAEALAELREGQSIGILPLVKNTEERRVYIEFSDDYWSDTISIYTNRNSSPIFSIAGLAKKTVAIPEASYLGQMLATECPTARVIEFPTATYCLSALNQGAVDAYLGDLAGTHYQITLNEFDQIRLSAPTRWETQQLAFGVRKEWPALASILNKGLSQTSESDRAAMALKYYTKDTSKLKVLNTVITRGMIGSLLIILIVLAWNGTLRRKVRLNTEQLRQHGQQLEIQVKEKTAHLIKEKEQTDALLEAARVVLKSDNFSAVAERIFEISSKVIGASAGYIALLSEDNTEYELLFLMEGKHADDTKHLPPFPRRLRTPPRNRIEAAYENDLHKNSRYNGLLPTGVSTFKNLAFAPFTISGKVYGLIAFANKEDGFTDDDLEIAYAHAKLATMSLRNSRSQKAFEIYSQELEVSNSRLTSLIDNMPIGYAEHEIILDESGEMTDYRCLSANRAFTEQSGLTSDVVGKTGLEVLPEIEDYWIKIFESVALTGKQQSLSHHSKALGKYFEVQAFSSIRGQFSVLCSDITERKEVELEMVRLNELSRTSLELARAGAWHMDVVNYPERFYVSTDLMKLLGEVVPAGQDYILIKDWKDNLMSTNQEVGKEAIATLQTELNNHNGSSSDCTWQYTRKIDNQIRWFHSMAKVERNENGDAVYISGVTQDITAQKEAEDALRNSEASLKEAQQLAQLGNIGVNLKTNEVVAWSDETLQILGLPQDAICHLDTILALVDPADLKAIQSTTKQAVETNETQTIEYRITRPDGDTRTIYQTERTIVDNSSGDLLLQATIQDITELRHAEERALLLSSVVENSRDFIGIYNLDLRCIYMNASAKRLLNAPLDLQISSLNIQDLHPDWVNDIINNEGLPAVVKYGEWKGETALLSLDGNIILTSQLIFPIMNSKNGKVQYYATIIRDINERKKQEARLRKAKEAAVAASIAKSDFLANMSHEIRTPLNAVIGMGYLIGKTKLDAQQSNYLKKMQVSAKILLGTINDILDFSKIEAGAVELEHTEFRLADVLHDVGDINAITAHKKGLDLFYNTSNVENLILMGDSLRLAQILNNLVSNAIKFTKSGSVVISAEILSERSEKIELRFVVKDTGIGISKDQQALLFSSFTQADTSTTRKFGGTGLGLSISKKLIEMMGGEIGVDSMPDQGSTFHFTVHLDHFADKITQALEEIKSRHVLIAVENSELSTILTEMLTPRAATVEAILNRDAVLLRLQQASFDIVFIDCCLGDPYSSRICAKIKELPIDRKTKIVSLGNDTCRSCGSPNCNAPLPKNFSLSDLYNAISRERKNQPVTSTLDKPVIDEKHVANKIGGSHVLLVEDNEINQDLSIELLEAVGLKVTLAENGQDAIQRLETNNFDIVLMDIQMPIMDGYEATRRIRSDARFETLPILAMTANVMSTDIANAKQAGMNAHIAKPIDPNELYTKLQEMIVVKHSNKRIQPKLKEQSQIPPRVSIDGLDLEKGMQSVAGRWELYEKILRKFITNYADIGEELSSKIKNKQYDDAQRSAHSLKGLAGSIGAHELQKAAKIAEQAIKDQHLDEAQTAFRQIQSVIEPLIANIQSTIGKSTEPAPTTVTAAGDTAEILNKLRAELKAGESTALQTFKRLNGVITPSQFKEVAILLENYAFEDALQALEGFEPAPDTLE
ncbi:MULTISPECIES: response regulator [unclassified Lentimonas]|uniref:response regulator n=1 Tax=unclassified Lentimonas TaxID=2630993 RepID=UPI001321EB16|nr:MULTISPECIES: transporter substrate-binding domain-containing protein [unclassified Lentimonas]CAA6677033.1 Unannotated [Lentimonas sp. CC4]CAA6687226.1 Unannotated [Lentimonas sp. CC6]CAA7074373.1 Unannotated [Lentimonas sp. CC4]CAA7171470.1 Unannotated [Lentimonas sp. CC21]CAA7180034.1 Unannotated [Lentimonas sp. CC8]